MEALKLKQLSFENNLAQFSYSSLSGKQHLKGFKAKTNSPAFEQGIGSPRNKVDDQEKYCIEYMPVEKGWLPIDAPNYMLINRCWVSEKGLIDRNKLYETCEEEAKSKGMDGIVGVVCTKKQPFMSEKIFFERQGFQLCDTAPPYFELWYKPFDKKKPIPKFKENTQKAECDIREGLVVYYTNACPFTEHYVQEELKEVTEKRGIKFTVKKLNQREAQNHFVPHTMYSIFYNGKFATQHILKEKYFDKFLGRVV